MAKAKAATAVSKVNTDLVLHLDPADILADDNIRYGLRPGDVERMAESITDRNGVQEPISVEPIANDGTGHKFRLLKGFIRHAAVTSLNAKGAGLTLPALLRLQVDPTERLKLQVAENVARAALSPMDEALSVKKLMDANVSRMDIRKIFARAGTSKGGTVSPVSNSWVNVRLKLLGLPEDIQAKIHVGTVSASAAQELVSDSLDPARIPDILKKAEEALAKEAKREDDAETKFLKAEAEVTKRETEVAEANTAVETAKVEVTRVEALVADKTSAYRAIQKEDHDPTDDKAKAAYKEKLEAGEVDLKAAQGLLRKAKNEVAKQLKRANTAAEVKAKLEALRSGQVAPVAPKPVGPKHVKGAAREDAAEQAEVKGKKKVEGAAPKLSAAEIRQAMKDIHRESTNSYVHFVIDTLTACFDGVTTPKHARETLEAKLAVKKK